MDFKTFLSLITPLQQHTLPGVLAHKKMMPPYRDVLIKQNRARIKTAKNSAVLALFYPKNKTETYFSLILRKTYKGVHSAQVGFPGGKVELEDESLQATALRETQEEIGVLAKSVSIITALTQVYIPPSNFNVFPFMGYVNTMPKFEKQVSEVELILEVALTELLQPLNLTTKEVTKPNGELAHVPAFKLQGHLVWGATAMILNEIKDLLKRLN